MPDLAWQVMGLTVFAVATMVGIFITKQPGFGKYTTSVTLLAVVLFVSSFFLLFGLINSQIFANILFAVTGYAGGLINGKGD